MKRVLLSILAITVALGMPSAAPAEDAPTVVTVSLSSFGALKANVQKFGKIMGIADLTEKMAIADKNGKPVIDPSKSWGLVVQVKDDKFHPIAFVPVKDFTALMEMISEPLSDEGWDVDVPDDRENGTWKLAYRLPPPFETLSTVYVKNRGGWALATQDKNDLDQVPDDPTSLLDDLNKQYDFAARATIKNVPKGYRQQAMTYVKMGSQGMAFGMRDDPNAATMLAVVNRVVKELGVAASELDDMRLCVTIDGDNGEVVADLMATALEGTQLADQFAQIKPSTSHFSGFDLPGAAIVANGATTLTGARVKQLTDGIARIRATAMTELKEQGLSDKELKTATDLLNDTLDVAKKTVEAKTLDGGLVAIYEKGKSTAAAGVAIADGATFDKVVKQLVGMVVKESPEIAKMLKLDAESHAGVRFHVFSMPTPDPKAGEIFIGKTLRIALGIGPNAVYAGAGADPVGVLKQAIDKSKSQSQKEFPPGRISVTLTPIIKLATEANEGEMPDQVADALMDTVRNFKGKDHITMTVKPIPRGARARIRGEQGLFELIGVAVQMAIAEMEDVPGDPFGAPPPAFNVR